MNYKSFSGDFHRFHTNPAAVDHLSTNTVYTTELSQLLSGWSLSPLHFITLEPTDQVSQQTNRWRSQTVFCSLSAVPLIEWQHNEDVCDKTINKCVTFAGTKQQHYSMAPIKIV